MVNEAPSETPALDRSATDAAERWQALGWLGACAAATAILALFSNGTYHDDDLKHFLFARWTRFDPEYLVHTWGRPGFTLLHALPAQLGWTACRLLSVGLTALTAWATFRCAQQLGLRHAAWAVPLTYAQPLVLHLSFTTLTETPMAAQLALATWALLAGRRRTSAMLFSLTLVTRHEAIVLLPIWAWALWSTKKSTEKRGWTPFLALGTMALLFCAPAAHNVATRLAFGYWPWAILTEPGHTTHYGQGTPLTFLVRFVSMAGPVVATWFVVGCRVLWRDRRTWPLLAGVAAYIAVQTALYMHQAYATGGYARFLVPIAPWVALGALAGVNALRSADPALRQRAHRTWLAAAISLWVCLELEQMLNPSPTLQPYLWPLRAGAALFVAGVSAGLLHRGRLIGTVIVVLALLGPLVRAGLPHRLRPRERAMAEAVEWLHERDWAGRPFFAVNDWLYYFADRWYPARSEPWYDILTASPPGALFLWDARYGPSPDFGISLELLRAYPLLAEIGQTTVDGENSPFVCIFERQP